MKQLISLLILLLTCAGSVSAQKLDTSRITVLTYDTSDMYMKDWFPEDYTKATLNDSEAKAAGTLLERAISKYNIKSKKKGKIKRNPNPIDLKRYKRQYIPVYAANGDKLVLVNCFCTSYDGWKDTLVAAFGGGSCFFRVDINLTKRTYTAVIANGSK